LTQAFEALVQAIRLDPSLADAYFNLGAVHVARRERDAALEQYATLSTLDPKLARKLFKGIYNGKVIDAGERSAFRRKMNLQSCVRMRRSHQMWYLTAFRAFLKTF